MLTEQDFIERTRRPGVHLLEYRHEGGCPTLTTGSGADCQCDPELHLYEGAEDGSRRYVGEVAQ